LNFLVASGPPPTLSGWYCSDILWYLQAASRKTSDQWPGPLGLKWQHVYTQHIPAWWKIYENPSISTDTIGVRNNSYV
jgi:hypothetical protein